MKIEQYIEQLGIDYEGEYGDDAYVIPLMDSAEYGIVFSTLDQSDDIEILQDNQVVTEQGSSLMFESKSQPFLLTLTADWAGDQYQLVVNELEVS